MFIAASAINSIQVVPQPVVDTLAVLDTAQLAMAMATLRLRTHTGALGINLAVTQLMS